MLPRRIFSKSKDGEADAAREAKLVRRQTLLGWLAALLCLVAGLALLDGLVAGAGNAARSVDVVAGGEATLAGPLPTDARSPADLRITTDVPGLTCTVSAVFSGFWLGNRRWRGTLRADARTAPQTASLILTGPTGETQRMAVRIFADQDAMDAASPSRLRRLVGWPPFGMAAFFFGWALAAGGGVFWLGGRREAMERHRGTAVVYRTRTTRQGQRIAFGLGSDQGLQPGAVVTVRSAAGQDPAAARVLRCTASDAVALMMQGKRADPGARVVVSPPQRAATNDVDRR